VKPSIDPDFDAKSFVARGYEQCGPAYTAARQKTAPSWLALLADRLPDGAAVLEIGCGSGIPITALASRFSVTGVVSQPDK
jgi:cyclopropane fatty-acyl-phospholipid synthase-like methyltransferase